MKISGKVLNVGDGDAIIIIAQKGNDNLLIVIDGGNKSYGQKVLIEVKKICDEYNKKAPDLIVCTHYDSDHIAGIITLVDEFKNDIKDIWIHQPRGVIKESLKTAPKVLEYIYNKSGMLNFNEHVLYQNYLAAPKFNEYRYIIESVGQLNELISLIKKYKIPTQEPIAGVCKIINWDEIKVIGPTQEYYDKVFDKQDNLLQIFQEEYDDLILENAKNKPLLISNPCEMLKKVSNITPTNKASAVIRFDCEDGKYLFTADAGIESLKNTLGYPESIKNMKFLKIPHHGSNNNISKELIDLINPEIAFNSGKNHEDPEVILCLKSNTNRIVKTTKELGDLEF